jgi:hypothetical protein
MEQLKRGLTNAAKRQMLRATEQPETANEVMEGENGAVQISVRIEFRIVRWSLDHSPRPTPQRLAGSRRPQ